MVASAATKQVLADADEHARRIASLEMCCKQCAKPATELVDKACDGQRFYRATLCQRGLGSRNSVCLSVCLSVRLSHACFVTNPKNLPARP